MKKIIVLLFIIVSIKLVAQPPPPDYSKFFIESSKTWVDVDYVGDGLVGHKLDIFLPKIGKGPFPVVIAIYGSAWFSNSSKSANFHVGLDQALLNDGFAVININHRSSREAEWPAQMHDVKAAIRFIRANASTFSLDNSFIGITGFSSGGHLSSMAGVTSQTKTVKLNGLEIDLEGSLGKFKEVSSHVDAVVDFFGPSNFLTMDECAGEPFHDLANSPESTLVGGALQENKDKVAFANPISFITRNDPPFLIFHGNKDPMVPMCQSEQLFEALQKEGVKSEFVIVKGGGHGPLVFVNENFKKMNTFFKEEQAKSK
jgi:acetyl esterase/lipase